MPEIRATLTTELHRKLKAEAARKGMHLKELIAQILEKHTNNQGGTKKPK
jgi:predicted HicB family RNase H-like nuclease